jgi:hypothetical protein
MTACTSRNASKSRNESNNMSVKAVGTVAKTGTLAKKKSATACRKANYSRVTIYIRDNSSSDFISSRREASNMHRMANAGCQIPDARYARNGWHGSQQLMSFHGYQRKTRQNGFSESSSYIGILSQLSEVPTSAIYLS